MVFKVSIYVLLSTFIIISIYRYVSTPSGVTRMFPGTLLSKNYDPSKRPWYNRAMEYPSHITLTAPYLDVGGAGYIVTMSHTIYEGRYVGKISYRSDNFLDLASILNFIFTFFVIFRAASMHGLSDRVAAVMGIDFTVRFMYRLLVDAMPFCDVENMR